MSPRKIAFVSPVWTTWQHRFMAGALRHADGHPRLLLRAFAPVKNLPDAARVAESWGADGILATLEPEDQANFLAALSRPVPMVNHALAREHPGVWTVVADFNGFLDTSIVHLRQLGIRSVAMLLLEEGPQVREHLLGPFLKSPHLPSSRRVSLVFPADREKLWNPHADVNPVPAPLADWLRSLPPSTGVLCPSLGGGGYLIRCCQALGLRVPEELAVIGGDDTDLSLAGEPTLTSVVPALETLGCEAMRLLADLLAGKPPPSSIVRVRCMNLHVRDSTGLRRPEICDIAGALQCIHDNACKGITVGQVIKQTQHVSKVTFHRRFREVVGKSPAEAIRERRFQEVHRLLAATDLPLTMVSDLCGFSSSQVLARAFRITNGVSPSDYRKRQHSKKKSLRVPASEKKSPRIR